MSWRTDGKPIRLPLDPDDLMYSLHLYLDALRKGTRDERELFMEIMQEQGYPKVACEVLALGSNWSNDLGYLVESHFGIKTTNTSWKKWSINGQIFDMKEDGSQARYFDHLHELIEKKYHGCAAIPAT